MNDKACRLIALIGSALVGILLFPPGTGGVWASPGQDPYRQTIPPALTPWAYLPIATRNYSVPIQSAPGVRPDRYNQVLNGPFPLQFGTGSESEGWTGDHGLPEDLSPDQDKTNLFASSSLLCRLGVDVVSRPIDTYPAEDLTDLRAGWYFSWSTLMSPPKLNGISFAQSVAVKQWKWDDGLVSCSADAPYAVPYTYTVSPPVSRIKEIAAANPGSLWLLGNEIERRDWPSSGGGCAGQNEILPEVYAWAYHEIYVAIKEADPTARVANGSIIVPTPLRLQYMTRMWDEYLRRYQVPMPVDVWHIHVYLGPEKRNDWGIDVPAGTDADVGMFYFGGDWRKRVLVNKDFSYIPGLVRDFRAWMKERGQQNKPLIISEFGVSMPDWVMEGEFTPEKVRDEYMYPGLSYMLNAADPNLGCPADEYRLVQSVWWWSLDGDGGNYDGGSFFQYFNGNLLWSGLGAPTHSPNPMGASQLGNYWISYISALTEQVNLRPLTVVATPSLFSGTGEPVTATLRIQLSNSGNVAATQPFGVTLYDGADQEVGSFVVNGLAGCGEVAEAVVTWPDLAPGTYAIRVVVDPADQISEAREDDNEMWDVVLVATYRVNLPIVLRSW